MALIVSKEIFEKYPNARIGVIIARNIDNAGENEEITRLIETIQTEVRKNFSNDNISLHPSIAEWRRIYSSFGSKPSDYRSSIEALIRSVLKGRNISHINKLVDLYNFISLKHVIPAGGEDLDKIDGNIYLRFAVGNENFVPLGSDKVETAYRGEVIYCDGGNSVLCRRWNWRESDKTKITEDTRNAIIVLEGFDDKIAAATHELETLIQKYCSANTMTFMINKNKNVFMW